jgi:hypothetical protein
MPDDLARLSAFVGTDDMVRERLRALRDAGITTVRAEPDGATADERLQTLQRFVDLVRQQDDDDIRAGSEGPAATGGSHA